MFHITEIYASYEEKIRSMLGANCYKNITAAVYIY
jgi:hypothetical protein